MFRSITTKLIIYSLTWIGFGVSLFGYIQYQNQSTMLHQQLQDHVTEMEQRLKINLPVAVWNFDRKSVLENIRSELVPKEIIAILVVDESGVELASAGEFTEFTAFQIDFPLVFKSENIDYNVGKTMILVNEELIEIALSENLYTKLTEVVFLAISLSLILYLLIKFQIIKPLSVLEISMKNIASHENNLYRRIEIDEKNDNEIARVSKNFNAIISRIEKLNQSISNKNIKLNSTIEDLQDTQKQLIESEKLASLGSLVAGVAHEINTPVGVGITASTTLTEQTRKLVDQATSSKMTKKDFEEGMELISDAANLIYLNLDRVAKLVSSFKQVAVDRVLDEPRNIDIGKFSDQILDSIRPTYKHSGFHFENTIDADLIIRSHPGLLAQIITNLLINAAIHGFDEQEKGIIKITTESYSNGIVLIISDTGVGMSDKVVHKIFEPFFTTRRNQGGTGLGLHIVYNIVTQKLGGSIQCQSVPGEGTTFRVKLPAHTVDPFEI